MRRTALIWLWLFLAALSGAAGCAVISGGEPVEPDPGLVTMVWERSFGSDNPGIAHALQQTGGGGLILAGQGAAGEGEPFLLCTDGSGMRQWQRSYGSGGKGAFFSVRTAPDGGLIATGQTRPGGAETGGGLYLLKTGPDGEAQWERVYGEAGNACGLHAVPDSAGGYAACGLIDLPGGERELYLLQTDAAGRARWEHSFGRGEESTAQFVLPVKDGGFLAVGWTKPEGSANRDVYAIKVDRDGLLEWEGVFGGTEDEIGSFARQEEDGGFTIVGQYFSYAAGGSGVYLIRLDEAGRVLQEKHTTGSDQFLGLSVHPAAAGGCLSLGQVIASDGYRRIGLACLDRDGLLAWEAIFGGAGDAAALAALQTEEGDYVVAGWSEAPGSGRKEVYMARLRP